MRVLVMAKMPNEEFNEAMEDGKAGKKIEQILDELKPETVYFTEMHGMRSAMLIVNIDDPAQIPAIAEPFFLTFNASVHFHILMSKEDLKRAGLEELGKKWA